MFWGNIFFDDFSYKWSGGFYENEVFILEVKNMS